MRFYHLHKRLSILTTVLLVVGLAVGVYRWQVNVLQKMPDFASYETVGERKRAFFGFLGPLVASTNAGILKSREQLLTIEEKLEDQRSLGWYDLRRLVKLAVAYEVLAPEEKIAKDDTALHRTLVDKLLLRVDIVPKSMALVQAAKESGWGRSRFVLQGNNFFGQRCYSEGCGVIPHRRTAGSRFEVQAFASPRDSVESYIHNLNTHWAYRKFRAIRAELRETSPDLKGRDLIVGLQRYSERGSAYIKEVLSLIAQNKKALRTY